MYPRIFTGADDKADIGPIVPRSFIAKAGGTDNIRTIKLSDELRLHQRRDFGRWRDPVNGKRPFKTVLFPKMKRKTSRSDFTHCESARGERAMYAYFDIDPPITDYWEQRFLVELRDNAGAAWAVPDAFAAGNDKSFAFIEGKVAAQLVVGTDGRTDIVRGLSSETEAKLARLQGAFSKAGYHYVVFDERWAYHPIRAENINLILEAARDLDYVPLISEVLEPLLDKPDLTVGECAKAFPGRDCPEELVALAMAHGVLEIDIEVPFARNSAVKRPGKPFWSQGSHA